MEIKSILDPVARSYFKNKYLDADAYDEGYESGVAAGTAIGKQEEYDRFWDEFQKEGSLDWYNFAFYGPCWDDDNYNPKYPINGTGRNHAAQTFNYSEITDTRVDIDVRNEGVLSMTFAYTSALQRIKKLIVDETTTFSRAFYGAENLSDVTIEGTIGQNGVSVSDSPLLTHDSLMSIINALKDYSADTSGTVWTVTLGDANLAKLSEADIAIAEGKGWVLA